MFNVAIVGCGYWGANYVRVCSELPNSRVRYVCDERRDRLVALGRRFPSVESTACLEDLCASKEVDAAIIATPPSTHHRIAKNLLAHGKHVLIEKPLAASVEEGEDLVRLAERMGVVLMVGHTFLYNNGIRMVKECLGRPEFGRVYYLHSTRTNLGPIRHDVNVVWDLAPHDLSIFGFLLGERPLWACAVGSRLLGSCREDVAFVTLGYPNNVIGNIHVSWADPNKVRETVVVGSGRRIVFDDLSSLERVKIFEKGVACSPTEVDNFGEFRLLIRDGDIVSPRVEISEPLKEQCSHFLRCIETGRRPLTDGQNGVEILRVLTAIDASLQAGGAQVEVEAP